MPTQTFLNRQLLACITAASLCLFANSNVLADHCGCESRCEPCPPVTCDCACAKQPNCLQKAFDAMAAGLGKLFCMDDCGCDEMLCDDACDAVMIEELMLPAPATTIHRDQQVDRRGDHHDPAQHQQLRQPEEVPPPVRLPEPVPERIKKEEGSLFDSLSDPFGDDQARGRTYRPVRPSSYLKPSPPQEVELRPISRREVSRTLRPFDVSR